MLSEGREESMFRGEIKMQIKRDREERGRDIVT